MAGRARKAAQSLEQRFPTGCIQRGPWVGGTSRGVAA